LEATAANRPKSIDAVVQRVAGISTLPQVALKVMQVARDPNTGAAELRTVVEGDPALGARLLRMVNSAAYGVRSTVTNLQQAISYLGFNQVRNLAMTASVSRVFRRNEKIGNYQRTMLWRHLVSVGICARLVASRCRMPNFEDAFLAGLLHDIGIIIEDQHTHGQFCRVMTALSEETTLSEVEKQHLGFDHCMLGARIADAWRFPPAVRAAIRFHHSASQYNEEGADIVRCVEVANVICTLKGITSVGRRLVKPALETFQALGFQKEDIIVLATDLDQEIAMSESLFEL
jgi:putative nucleotidyltransferase with HDIG domain